MTETKKKYPRDFSDQELEEEIDKNCSFDLSSTRAPAAFTRASLGLAELQRRSASRFGKWSLRFSILAVILSGFAVYFSYSAGQLDTKWQRDQINLLSKIRCLLDDSRGRLPCP